MLVAAVRTTQKHTYALVTAHRDMCHMLSAIMLLHFFVTCWEPFYLWVPASTCFKQARYKQALNMFQSLRLPTCSALIHDKNVNVVIICIIAFSLSLSLSLSLRERAREKVHRGRDLKCFKNLQFKAKIMFQAHLSRIITTWQPMTENWQASMVKLQGLDIFWMAVFLFCVIVGIFTYLKRD